MTIFISLIILSSHKTPRRHNAGEPDKLIMTSSTNGINYTWQKSNKIK